MQRVVHGSVAGFSASGLVAGGRVAGYRGRRDTALLYAQVILLLGLTFVLGLAGIGTVRLAFIAGCVWIGYQAWLRGPARHLELSIILYIWAPFLRRVVDNSAGFDPSGFMLVGPVLSLLPPCLELYDWFVRGRLRRDAAPARPFILMGACLLYGFTLSLAYGDIVPAILASAKYLPPLAYGLWLMARGSEEPSVVEGAARGFLIGMSLAGIYGIYQYFYLPDWDAYWMTMSSAVIDSLGQPVAEQLRVFGPMNSAASFGHFALAALLLLAFVRRDWWSLLLSLPITIALLLTLDRTAWIALAVGFLYCWTHAATRRRANAMALYLVAGIALTLASASFSNTVVDRLSTMTVSPADDGSGRERLDEYSTVVGEAGELLIGLGIGGLGPFGGTEPHYQTLPTVAEDGSIIQNVLLFGWVVGGGYVLTQIWAVVQALKARGRSSDARLITARAIVIGNAVIMPLTGITTGEIGFLFLAFVGIASSGLVQRPAPSAMVSAPVPAA